MGIRPIHTAVIGALAITIIVVSCGRPDPTTPAAPPAAAGTEMVIGFDDMLPGQPPSGFLCAWPGPPAVKPARWEVIDDATAPTPGKVLQQSDADDTNHRYPVALWRAPQPANVRASVHARAIAGGRDRSFGVVVRAVDERNYYVARTNTSGWGENVRLYAMVDGVRRELSEWEGPVARDAWHELALEAVGDRLVVMLDGRTLIDHHDTTFTGPGMCGVWTKAEAVSRFDDLRIVPVQP